MNAQDSPSSARRQFLATVLSPAVRALNRLRFASKFLLVGLLLLAPFGYASTVSMRNTMLLRDMSEQKRRGIEVIAPLLHLLHEVVKSRVEASGEGSGRWSPSSVGKAATDRIEELVKLVDSLHHKYEREFRGSDGRSVPSQVWADLKQLVHGILLEQKSPRAAAVLPALSGMVAEWIASVSAATLLLSDTDVDSCWLMDVFTRGIPSIVGHITFAVGEALAATTNVPGSAPSSTSLKGDLLEAGIATRLADAEMNLETAYSWNSAQGGEIASILMAFERRAFRDTRMFLDVLRSSHTAVDSHASEKLLQPAMIALDSLLALHDATGGELDKLLAARSASYQSTLNYALLAVLGATVLLVYVASALYLSIRQSVSQLRKFTAELIAGTTATFRLDTSDELGEVAVMYNDINIVLTQVRSLQRDLEMQAADLQRANDCLVSEMAERRRLEAQLLQAQKLEAIGQLAAGIAHEINTPTQYIGDNVRFVRDAFEDIAGLVDMPAGTETSTAVDVAYLCEEIPRALDQALEGIRLITEIVRAMKEFSHPDGSEVELTDLNHRVIATTTVCRNEWKYVAELTLDLDPELPSVPCFPGPLNQALLNIVVNAAHAISERKDLEGGKGRITVSTRRDGDWVEIRIGDTGVGIPEAIRGRIFDPFFTTKEVGKGTGQGLAIAYNVVVKKHKGEIHVESDVGDGATFTLRLPRGEAPAGAQSDGTVGGQAA